MELDVDSVQTRWSRSVPNVSENKRAILACSNSIECEQNDFVWYSYSCLRWEVKRKLQQCLCEIILTLLHIYTCVKDLDFSVKCNRTFTKEHSSIRMEKKNWGKGRSARYCLSSIYTSRSVQAKTKQKKENVKKAANGACYSLLFKKCRKPSQEWITQSPCTPK